MKKMNLPITATIVAFMLFSCGAPEKTEDKTDEESTVNETPLDDADLKSENFTVNLDSSKVHWSGNMVGLYSHEGWVKLKDGDVEVTDGRITGGSFVVDMTTITPTDANFDPKEGKTKEKLTNHLSSEDFFKTSEFPTAKFEITGVDMDNNQLIGNLTIRGITHEETIDNVKFNREEGTANGKLVFDRSTFDVKFKHPAQEMVISNDIELDITLQVGS